VFWKQGKEAVQAAGYRIVHTLLQRGSYGYYKTITGNHLKSDRRGMDKTLKEGKCGEEGRDSRKLFQIFSEFIST